MAKFFRRRFIAIERIPATVPPLCRRSSRCRSIKDPFYGMNRNLPGMDYPLGRLFSDLAMLDTSPYKCGVGIATVSAAARFSGHLSRYTSTSLSC
jgi:hypothetical protein